MKKKFFAILSAACMTAAMPISLIASAEEVTRDEMFDAIWSGWYYGEPDDGTTFPEASYEKHLIDNWLDENFEQYKNDLSYGIYCFKSDYTYYVEQWSTHEDPDTGEFYVLDAEENMYHFSYRNGQWNMSDDNGNVIDSFPAFSTMEYEAEHTTEAPVTEAIQTETVTTTKAAETEKATYADGVAGSARDANTGNSAHRVTGTLSASAGTGIATTQVVESTTESKSSKTPLLVGTGVVVVGIGGFAAYRVKFGKKGGGNNNDSKK